MRITAGGFSSPVRITAGGFSLVEMLVALTIFAIVSTAGVMLLRSSIDTQGAVSRQLTDASGVARLRAMLNAELAAAQPRATRAPDGSLRPALSGSETAMSVVYASEGTGSEAGVARATYRLDQGALVRDGASRIDGEAAGSPATIVRDVASLGWRYRALDGGWNAVWAPDRPDRLPRAVELTITRTARAPLTMLFLLSPDGLPPPGREADAPS
ncbi:MAG: type II secretion system protein GspJ [Sphingopyxis sp.]